MKDYLDKIPIFFIVTKARSGSTLVQSIFDAHANISAPLESRFVLHLYKKYHYVTTWNDVTINKFIKDVFTDRSYRLFWGINELELKNLFLKYYITSFSDACKVVYLSYHSMFKKNNINVIVDKNPFYARYIPELLEIFPDAKFIHLIRDPRAVVSSCKIAFNGKTPRITYSWMVLNEIIETKKDSAIFLTIKYEDLVKHPGVTFQIIFNFLKIEYDKEVLNAHLTINKVIDNHNYLSLEHHRNVSMGINTKSIDSWKNKLSEKEKQFINYMTADFAKKYGYEITKPNLTANELKAFNKSIKPRLFNIKMVVVFYKLPFFVRKTISNIISLFFDKRYKKIIVST